MALAMVISFFSFTFMAMSSSAGGYGKETWEIHAYNLGIYYNGKNDLNLVIQSVAVDTDHNNSCWPVVDALLIRRMELAKSYRASVPDSVKAELLQRIRAFLQSAL